MFLVKSKIKNCRIKEFLCSKLVFIIKRIKEANKNAKV